MATDSNGITLYSDQDLLNIARAGLASAMQAQAYTVSGRSKQMAAIEAFMKTIGDLEQRIASDANAASGEGGNVAVASFDPPT